MIDPGTAVHITFREPGIGFGSATGAFDGVDADGVVHLSAVRRDRHNGITVRPSLTVAFDDIISIEAA